MLQEQKREECEEYLRKHKIKELFEDLCTEVAYKQPENLEKFLIDLLTLREQRNEVTLPIFTEEEIENIFDLYNLKKEKFISREKAKEALGCIANSSKDLNQIK